MEQTSLKPLFDESARQGALMGIVLSAVSVCMLLSMRMEVLALVCVTLCLAVPVVLLFTLRRVAAVNIAYCRFAALWMSGIVQFLCGGLICCFATLVTLVFLGEGFLREYIIMAFEQATGRRGLSLDGVAVPSNFDYANSLFWLTASSGSLLSLVYASVLPRLPLFTEGVLKRRRMLLGQ